MSSDKAPGDMLLAITAVLAMTVSTIKADCHQPLPPTNGYVTSLSGRIPAGRVARIVCNRHYKFHDTNNTVRDIRCLPNGQWETYPPCQATVTCNTPPSKVGGSWILTGRGPGDQCSVTRARATFRCNPGHYLVDLRKRSVPQELVVYCGNNLQWDGRWFRRMYNPGFRCLGLFEKLARNKTGEFLNTKGRPFDLNAPDGCDITFLIGTSGSIQEFNDAVQFVRLFVAKIGLSGRPDGTRIAAASFAANPEYDLGENNGFMAGPPKTLAMVKKLLDQLQYRSCYTNVNDVLAFYRMNMLPMHLLRREKAKQYLFILSDGQYNRGGSAIRSAMELRRDPFNVEIFSVKIGKDIITDEARKKTQFLIDLSSEEDMNVNGTAPHYFNLQSYATIDYLVQKLLNGSIDE